MGPDCGDYIEWSRFRRGKVLANGLPGGECARDGHVTTGPRHKENGNTNQETIVKVYMKIYVAALAGRKAAFRPLRFQAGGKDGLLADRG